MSRFFRNIIRCHPLAWSVTALAAAALLGGCRGGSHGSAGHEGLVYWPAANAQEIELATLAAAEWNDAHPAVPVTVQPIPESQSTEEVLLAAVVGKTTPDICSNIWPGAVGQFVRAGALVPLDSFADFDSLAASRLPAGQREAFQHDDGRIYQMPWKTNPIMMEYNVRRLREAGFAHPPATYSEFIRAGQALTRDVTGDGQIDQWMLYVDINVKWWLRYFDFYTFYLAASGGQTLVKNRQIVFENAAAVEVFRFFRRCFELAIFPTATFQGDTFLSGQVATHITGPWNIAHVDKFKPEGFEFDYAPIPLPDGASGPVVTYGDPKNIAIFTTCKNPRAAWEFVKFLVSRRQDLALLQTASQLPIRRDLLNDSLYLPYFKANPRMVHFAEQAPRTLGVDNAPELREVFDAISQEFEACCVLGRRTPEEAVHRAAERARQILR